MVHDGEGKMTSICDDGGDNDDKDEDNDDADNDADDDE